MDQETLTESTVLDPKSPPVDDEDLPPDLETEDPEQDEGESVDDPGEEELDSGSDVLFVVDGKSVTIEDARQAYLRQSQYEEALAVAKDYAEKRDKYAAALEQRIKEEEELAPKMPPPSLKYTDPQKYRDQLAEYVAWKSQQDERKEHLAKIEREREEEQRKAHEETLRYQVSLIMEKVPSIKEAKTAEERKSALSRLYETAKDAGFTDVELNGLIDHRLMLILDWASRGKPVKKETTVTKKSVSTKSVQPTLKKSARTEQVDPAKAREEELRNRLKKTGNIEDAMAYLRNRRQLARG